jgi:hypothetical protein
LSRQRPHLTSTSGWAPRSVGKRANAPSRSNIRRLVTNRPLVSTDWASLIMDLIGVAFLLLVAFAAGFLTRANISRRRRATARHLRGDS